jgi:hypothetical protein
MKNTNTQDTQDTHYENYYTIEINEEDKELHLGFIFDGDKDDFWIYKTIILDEEDVTDEMIIAVEEYTEENEEAIIKEYIEECKHERDDIEYHLRRDY